MLKITFLLLLTTFSFFNAKAVTPWLKVYEIKSDTASRAIGMSLEYLQRFDDKSGKLNINDVSAPGFENKFYQLNNKNQYFDEKVRSYWVRYRFKNTLGRPVRIMMYGNSGVFEYYMQLPNNQFNKQTIGTGTPWKGMSGFRLNNAVYYQLAAGQEALFYKHVLLDHSDVLTYVNNKLGLGLVFWFYDPFVQNELNNDRKKLEEMETQGLIGVMLLAGLVGLVMYTLVKDKIYLYFGLVTLCLSVVLGNLTVVFFTRYYPEFHQYLLSEVVSSLLFYYLWRFLDLFFDFSKHFRRAGKALFWLTCCFALFASSAPFIPAKYWSAILGFLYSYLAMLPITILFCLIHPKTTSRAKVFAVLPLIVVFVYMILIAVSINIFGVNIKQTYILDLLFFSFFWLVISFIRMLLKRLIGTIRQSEAERNELIVKQNA